MAVCLALGARPGRAEVFSGPNVQASFHGWLTPRTLPRTHTAPVALHMAGALRAIDGREPPKLQRLTISINRGGRLSTVGLPLCRLRSIEATTTKLALAACRSALVGVGRFTAHIAIPSEAPFPARGKVLAFNATLHGRPVILAQVYGTEPVPTSRILILSVVRRRKGAFGTTLSVRMPSVATDWGYATGFRLTLHRLYSYRGRERSLLSASCPAPRGFGRVSFTAAKGTYYLEDGRRIARSLYASCEVGA
ncbi:MAG TPA: hypothetical protein VND98_04990 [Solirubrobacterales bacterium]|nr:hypothetical protein [Solirubrobacterales bacterium]